MKPPKQTPAAFAAVLTIEESEALAILGQIDTAANRRALRAKLQHTGPAAAPRYYDADVRSLASTGKVQTANRSAAGVDMRRVGGAGRFSRGRPHAGMKGHPLNDLVSAEKITNDPPR
jgi:hypothetical protein